MGYLALAVPGRLTLIYEINYQVSDSGCVVTVRDTGVASLAPQNTDQRDRRRPPGSPCRFANFRQVIQLAPNCPVMQYLIYQ